MSTYVYFEHQFSVRSGQSTRLVAVLSSLRNEVTAVGIFILLQIELGVHLRSTFA